MTPLHINAETMAQALTLAEQLKIPVEEVISQAIQQFDASQSPANNRQFIGSFSESADVLDEIVEEAFQRRDSTTLRLDSP